MHNFLKKKKLVQLPRKNYLKMKKVLSGAGDPGPRLRPGGPDAQFPLFLWASVSPLQGWCLRLSVLQQVPTPQLRCKVASKVTQFPIYPAGGAVRTSLYQKNLKASK